MSLCLMIDEDVHHMKAVHCVKSATVMEDGSIVLVVVAKDSPNCAQYILRFDVRKLQDNKWALNLRGQPLRYPTQIHTTGQVKCCGENLVAVEEVVDSMHGNRKKIIVKVSLNPEDTQSKNRVVHQRYSEYYLD